MTQKKKRGKLSRTEQEFIAVNHETMSVAEIANHLRRSEEVVRKEIGAVPTRAKTVERGDWVSRLHASSFWADIRKGLMGTEVGYFEKDP